MQRIIPVAILILVIFIGILGVYFLLNQKNPSVDLMKSIQPSPSAILPQTQSQNVQNSPTVSPSSAQTAVASQNFPDGLKIEDFKIGTGSAVKSGDKITINYTGTLENGTKFDSSYDHGQPFETQIGVGQVIKGWDEGIIGMRIGGQRKLIIPASLGYGQTGMAGVIPPNSTLIFDVELEAIQ
jgi:peptidylprolyl isomerase